MSIKEKLERNPLLGVIILLIFAICAVGGYGVVRVIFRNSEDVSSIPSVQALVDINPKSKNPTKDVSGDSIEGPREVCESPECLTLAHQLILLELLALKNVNPADIEMNDQMNEVRKFTDHLNPHVPPYFLKKIPVADLKFYNPNIDFKRVIVNLASNSETAKKLTTNVFTYDFPRFFDRQVRIHHILKGSPKRAIANFLIFKFIEQSLKTIPRDHEMARRQDCTEVVMKFLPRATVRLFVQKYFETKNLEIVSDLIDQISVTFTEYFDNSTWLNPSTKKSAILKVKNMKKMVGYTKDYEPVGTLDKMFETLDLQMDDSYYTMTKKLLRFRTEQKMEYIAKNSGVDPEAMIFETNAFYTNSENLLTVSVPIIDDPLFDTTFPNYAKLANTGKSISHQIAHGFDLKGRMYNENSENKVWWTLKDRKEYYQKSECLFQQYTNYDDPDFGKNLHGLVVLNEMIADRVGMEVAVMELKKSDSERDPEIVGLRGESVGKLFFQIAALNHCSTRNKDSLRKMLSKTHPTSSFRVNGVFSNLGSFAEAYNCPVGSPMNPEKKCDFF